MTFILGRTFLRLVMFVLCAGAVIEHHQLRIGLVGQIALTVAAIFVFILFCGD